MADENAEEVKDWAENNFKAMKQRLEDLQEEMRNNKPKQNISVRKVDSENLEGEQDDQIIVEHSVQRWYSVNYFKQMLKDDNSSNSNNSSNEDTIL